jgi:Ca-activated chloride channel family protein
VVYVGDAIPTVGEIDLTALQRRLDRLARPLRLFGVGVGAEAQLTLLEGLAGPSGRALRVETAREAGMAALQILEHLARPVLREVTAELDGEVDRVYPSRPVAIVAGDPLVLIGRLRGRAPTTVTIRGRVEGQPFDQRVPLHIRSIDELETRAALDVYQAARGVCELPGWRDRRALLEVALDRTESAAARVELWRAFAAETGVHAFLRRELLQRVRTAPDLRVVHAGLASPAGVDAPTVARLLEDAPTVEARVKVARDLARRWPDDLDLAVRLLDVFEEHGAPGEARRRADRIRASPAADARARTRVGELYLRDGDLAAARRAFTEIVELAPFDPYARRWVGDLLRAHGWWDDAARQYRTLQELVPGDLVPLLLLAQSTAGAGRGDEALRLLARVAASTEGETREGASHWAMLLSSLHLAELRRAARAAGDGGRLAALEARTRASGVLREAGGLRVILAWAHPEAGLELWTAVGHPSRAGAAGEGSPLARTDDLGDDGARPERQEGARE